MTTGKIQLTRILLEILRLNQLEQKIVFEKFIVSVPLKLNRHLPTSQCKKQITDQ